MNKFKVAKRCLVMILLMATPVGAASADPLQRVLQIASEADYECNFWHRPDCVRPLVQNTVDIVPAMDGASVEFEYFATRSASPIVASAVMEPIGCDQSPEKWAGYSSGWLELGPSDSWGRSAEYRFMLTMGKTYHLRFSVPKRMLSCPKVRLTFAAVDRYGFCRSHGHMDAAPCFAFSDYVPKKSFQCQSSDSSKGGKYRLSDLVQDRDELTYRLSHTDVNGQETVTRGLALMFQDHCTTQANDRCNHGTAEFLDRQSGMIFEVHGKWVWPAMSDSRITVSIGTVQGKLTELSCGFE